MAAVSKTAMKYRFMGNTGLLVSQVGLGSWMNKDPNNTVDSWYALMKLAFEHGINFFDNAELYGEGYAEELMGGAIQKGVSEGVWAREDLVITTKIFFGTKGMMAAGPNDQGLSRKHIIEGTKASLKRLELDYVDVVYCHRPEPYTPMEEVVRAWNFVIDQGWAFYWGTSEWSAAEIREACEVADRLGLIRPVVEQTEYSILTRSKVEFEYAGLYKRYNLGLSTWSPLAWGVLTGKYSKGIEDGSRYSVPIVHQWRPGFKEQVEVTAKLQPLADELGCTMAQFAIAWAVSNERASTVILGARNVAQFEENVKAIEMVDKITPEIKAKVDAIVNFVPRLSEKGFESELRALHL